MANRKKNKDGRNYSQDDQNDTTSQDGSRSMVQVYQANNILPDQQNNISSGGEILGGLQSPDKPCISKRSSLIYSALETRGQADGREQIPIFTEEETRPSDSVQEANVLSQHDVPHRPRSTGANIEQHMILLIRMMLQWLQQENRNHQQWVQEENQEQLQRLHQENRIHQQRVQDENQEQLQWIKQENRNHQQRVHDENQEQLQRIKQENRNHQQRVQEENQEQLQRIKQENRNHQQWVQNENQEQLQRIKQENRNHQQRVQEENQEQLQRIKQENRNHQQRVQGGNQEQWIKWENRNHQLWMQSKERKQHNQMQQENQEHSEQQLRQLRQERIKDLQLKQKENLNMHKPVIAKSFVMEPHWKQRDGADYSDEGEGIYAN
ncbi:putative mediator of RNA polymerase II transcription subunit 26 [Mercenaria mercenaria]|uniref:putative mediator of RNA polymerase II transcription subunit 26 n=1 Tax=Mercenaria mercenaria TaxID=6596 RepID=UPI00234F4F2A|nr:putative mediator of RNA polymerase II transcription subunit 26 [Mercenaria mercenaria]